MTQQKETPLQQAVQKLIEMARDLEKRPSPLLLRRAKSVRAAALELGRAGELAPGLDALIQWWIENQEHFNYSSDEVFEQMFDHFKDLAEADPPSTA